MSSIAVKVTRDTTYGGDTILLAKAVSNWTTEVEQIALSCEEAEEVIVELTKALDYIGKATS